MHRAATILAACPYAVLATVLVATTLAPPAPAAAAPATAGEPDGASGSAWTPDAFAGEDTLELTTQAPDEEPYTFPVWLVVVDGQLYVRLGTRAAGRVERNRTAPLLGVTVAGRRFERVRADAAPDMAARVAEAMAAKYWTDVVIRWAPHPLTLRLTAE